MDEPQKNAPDPDVVENQEPPVATADTNPQTELTAEVDKWKDLAMRKQAELENFRRRMAAEKSDSIKYGNANLLEDLLPILDNFRFGLEAARKESEQSVVFQGMSMVMKQFDDFLASQGVQEVPSEGKPFDPTVHEAVNQEYSDQAPEGQVLTVIRRGFRLSDRLLRAAAVVVSKGPKPAEPEAGQ